MRMGCSCWSFVLNTNCLLLTLHFNTTRSTVHSWQHPRPKLWHTLDYCLINKSQIHRVRNCSVARKLDCRLDHNAVLISISLNRGKCKSDSFKSIGAGATKAVKLDYTALVRNYSLRSYLGAVIDTALVNFTVMVWESMTL